MTVWQKLSGFATAVGDAGGSCWASSPSRSASDRNASEPQKHIAFTIGVIALSAKMAKADGVVAAWRWRPSSRCSSSRPRRPRNVERVFDLAKQDVAGYEAYADQIARLLKDDRKLLQHVLEGLLHVAAADGILHPEEDAVPARRGQRLGFSDSEFRFFRARFVTDHGNPYDVLRLAPDATNDEIKAQYRKLVADNHPDKLMGDGVPAEFVEIATRKLAAINAAYDTIAKERGL